MHAHVEELAARVRGELERGLDGRARVLRVGAHQHDLADVARVDLALSLGIGLVKAAHEAQLEDQLGMCLDDLFRVLALGDVRAERLLAEYVLAMVHCNLDLLAVQEGGGNDHDRVQLGVFAHFLKIRVGVGDAKLLGNLLDALFVYVADRRKLAAGYLRGQIAGVLVTQTAQTNRTNLDSFHNMTLLFFSR